MKRFGTFGEYMFDLPFAPLNARQVGGQSVLHLLQGRRAYLRRHEKGRLPGSMKRTSQARARSCSRPRTGSRHAET